METELTLRVHKGVTGDAGIQRVLLTATDQTNDDWLYNPHDTHLEFSVDANVPESQTFQQGKVVTATFTEVAE